MSRGPVVGKVVLAAVVSTLWLGSLRAAPSQLPLLGRGARPALPNVLMTVDDSGSMSWNYMPDDRFILQAKVHPAEPTNWYGYKYDGTFATRLNDWPSTGARASSFNPIYYDPQIRYQPWSRADGSLMPDAPPAAAPIHPMDPALGTANLVGIQRQDGSFCYMLDRVTDCRFTRDESFAPATYYDYIGDNPRSAAAYRRVRIADSPSFLRGPARTDCPIQDDVATCSQAQEYQNFANWFTYHRNRAFVAISALSGAFAAQRDNMRLGYGAINKMRSTVDGVDSNTVIRGVRDFVGSDRAQFFDWLHTLRPTGGTPLRGALGDAGEYFSRRDDAGPWGHRPGSADATPHLACRRSFQILMTDGYATDARASNPETRGNVDGSPGPVIRKPTGETYQYFPVPPYMDSASSTLADIAMYYWNRDLRPDLPNVVPADAQNPAFWQHMSTFTIGLGVNGTLRYPEDLAALSNGSKAWPSTVPPNSPAAVDDLWHAAINGRGRYLSARNADQMRQSLDAILKQIASSSENGISAGVSGRVLDGTNRKFVPSYKPGLWSGELTALRILPDGSTGGETWVASENLPPANERRIFLGTGIASPSAVPFEWSTLSSELRAELGRSATADASLVDYLRGDPSGEGKRYRVRDKRLGDIVNSTPVYVKGDVDLAYGQTMPLGTPGRDSYADFVKGKTARPGVVYVGANDGMLHAFDEQTGRELFAFIPRSVLPRLGALADPAYSHRFYVDGPLVESDAYLSDRWTNVLVGSTGAGSRSVFALDVTRPDALGAASVLWEFSDAQDAQMGHVLAPIEVGRLKDGRWAAVFGNGYESAGQRPSLFVIDLQTGRLIRRLDAGAPSSRSNGLGGIQVLRDGQRTIIGAYGGDLLGNVWKFDLASETASDWRVAFDGAPLYRALRADGSPQAITAPPTIISHPRGGQMVLVGTGKLFEEGDQDRVSAESLYGLWDKQRLVERSPNVWRFSDEGPIGSADALVRSTVGADQSGFRSVVAPRIDWSRQRGWAIPIDQAAGQRQLISARLINGLALFDSIVPVRSSDQSPCDPPAAASGVTVLVDPLTGGQPTVPTIDRNRDGVIDSRDGLTGMWSNRQWTGATTMLAEPIRPVCPGGTCAPVAAAGICPPGSLRSSLQNFGRGASNVCVAMPAPTRWWWRQLSVPD